MLMPAFHQWPDEAAIVGRLLVDYGELEFDSALSLGHAISNKRQGCATSSKRAPRRQELSWPKKKRARGGDRPAWWTNLGKRSLRSQSFEFDCLLTLMK
jgi:hypothetical protein